jgi:hypothetical protein
MGDAPNTTEGVDPIAAIQEDLVEASAGRSDVDALLMRRAAETIELLRDDAHVCREWSSHWRKRVAELEATR